MNDNHPPFALPPLDILKAQRLSKRNVADRQGRKSLVAIGAAPQIMPITNPTACVPLATLGMTWKRQRKNQTSITPKVIGANSSPEEGSQ